MTRSPDDPIIRCPDHPISFSLNGRLNKASFAWAQEDETWADWSEATESARLKEYRQELDAQLGGKAEFPWGRVSAILDSKSGGTDIWIDYAEPSPPQPAC